MKRKILLILLIAGLAVLASAQGWERGGRYPRQPDWNSGGPRNWLPAAEAVTVSGSLVVANGSPAVKSGDVTYLLRGTNRLIGFVDGFKEGAQVTIEGRAINISNDSMLKFLRPSKMTLNGKSYDLEFPEMNLGPGGRFPTPPNGPRHGPNWGPRNGPYPPHMRYHWQNM